MMTSSGQRDDGWRSKRDSIARVRGYFRQCQESLSELEANIIRELEEDGDRDCVGYFERLKNVDIEVDLASTKLEPSHDNYFQLSSLTAGCEKNVKIVSVWSPDHIIVTLLGHDQGSRIKQSLEKIDRMKELEPVRDVSVGKPCLVSVGKSLYRGKVINIERDLVTVLLVDEGQIEVRNRSHVYEISPKLLETTEACLVVKLDGVLLPSSCSSWLPSSTDILRERIEGKAFLMFIQKEKESELSPLPVILYEDLPTKMLCINFWLTSTTEAVLTSDGCMSLEYIKPGESPSRSEEESVERTGVDTLSAQVVSIESPSNILVRSLLNQREVDKLAHQLNTHFQSRVSLINRNQDIKKNDFVGVKRGDDWVRGKVKNFLPGKATVQLIDFGTEEIVKVKNLRKLPKTFQLWDSTEQVHLGGITPTSQNGNWSQNVKEYLTNILLTCDWKVELKCLGKSVNKSTPVKMLIMEEKDENENALVDLGDKLVAEGFALGNLCAKDKEEVGKREKIVDDSPEVKEEREVQDWLVGERLDPGTSVELALATYVDWHGLVHLARSPSVLNMVSEMLSVKYEGSLSRPVDKFWSVGEAAIVLSDFFSGWHRAVVLEVGMIVRCQVNVIC